MEVRYGPARVSFSGNEAAAREHLPRALKLLRQTQERARLGGLSVLGNQWRLDDDSYCYAVLAGGIAAVHIVSGYADEQEATKVLPVDIPDFVSGVIRNGHIKDVPATTTTPAYKVLETFHPTRRCATTFELPHSYQAIERLAVEPWTAFDELRNDSPSGQPVFSQYTRLKPTMYSGTMRKVVQALMGFGRQRRRGDQEFSRYDTRRGGTAPAAKPGQYAREVARDGLQIRYDWRFSRTHGITRGGDGTLWLVEISINAGVLAMPLPLHARTTTPAFRERMEKLGDADALALLDAFGGFPTGEAFPAAAERDAWVRAGKVLRLAEPAALAPFYQCSAYSSAMGWAFNARGDEAHNTAYYYGEDGYMRGVHDAVNLRIGGITTVTPARQAGVLKERLATLRGKKEFEAGIEAAIWKVDRMAPEQVWAALRRTGAAAAFAEVDALVLAPLASGSASRTRISAGLLVNRGKSGTQIKFPEPLIDLLLSVDMRPEQTAIRKTTRSDTTVHVFFVENELKWVKYFRDERSITSYRMENDYEPCMYAGSWNSHEETGGITLLPGFYSNDFDDRAEVAGQRTDTTIVRTILGYSQVSINDCLAWLPHAELRRFRRFRSETRSATVHDERVASGVAVPFFDREAYYYAVHRRHSGKWTSRQVGYLTLKDPWSYVTWRVFGGYTVPNAMHPDECGRGLHKRTVMKPAHFSGFCRWYSDDDIEGDAIYEPGGCSDYADSGPWSSVCTDADAQTYYIPPPPMLSESTAEPAEGKYDVWLVSSCALGPQRVNQVEDTEFGLWPMRSPQDGEENSADQSISTTHNAFGTADSLRYQVDLNSESRVIGVPRWPEMQSGALTYIGVIDGG